MKTRKLLFLSVAMILVAALLGVGIYAVTVNTATISTAPQVTFSVEEVFFQVKITKGTAGEYTSGTNYDQSTFSGNAPISDASATYALQSWTASIKFAGSDELVLTYEFINKGPNNAKVKLGTLNSASSWTITRDAKVGPTGGTLNPTTTPASSGEYTVNTLNTLQIVTKHKVDNRLSPAAAPTSFGLGDVSITAI